MNIRYFLRIFRKLLKIDSYETYILPFCYVFCFSVLSFAQRTNEAKKLTKQDSLRLQQLLSGQVEIVIDDETQKEIDRLFNPEKVENEINSLP